VDISIRNFEPADTAVVVDVQRGAEQAAQWDAADYEHLSREAGGLVLVADLRSTGSPVGFLAARVMGEDAELYNLAVAGTYRRRGAGGRLIRELHRRLLASGARRVSCEVRASNVAALNLYRAFGYVRCGVRRNYYANNGEDALLLQCDLRAAAAHPGRPPEFVGRLG
jgi:ribosomal-protein-alanine N-acetyltransferase